jgi:hypothetical protein
MLVAGLALLWSEPHTILAAAGRPRLAVLTDIGGDPDDQQSMVRLMAYANEFEIEALIATAVRANHTPSGPSTKPGLIREIVDAYGAVLPNLRRQATGWPAVETLRVRILSGNPRLAATLPRMEALLLAEMRRWHDPYRLWNQPNDGLTPPAEPPRAKRPATGGGKRSR